MKKFATLLVALALVSTASAQYTMIDDFESATLGSAHGQGGWQVQRNSTSLGDPGSVTIVDVGGNQVIDLMDRDLDAEIDTIYAALDLGVSLTGRDTLKITFRSNGPNDTLMVTNDKNPGWYDDGTGNNDTAAGGQGMTDYSDSGMMVVLKTNDVFRARDGSSGNASASGTNNYANTVNPKAPLADTWYDLYMLIDSPNARTIYAIAPAGGTPEIISNPNGGDGYWYHRNQNRANASVENLKFMVGGFPWPAMDIETHVQIDNIQYMNGYDPAVPEPATMSLLGLGGLALIRRRRS